MVRIIPFPLSPVSQVDVHPLQELWRTQTVPSHLPQGQRLVAQLRLAGGGCRGCQHPRGHHNQGAVEGRSWEAPTCRRGTSEQTLGSTCKATGKPLAPRSLCWDHGPGAGDATGPWALAADSLAAPRPVATASANPLPEMQSCSTQSRKQHPDVIWEAKKKKKKEKIVLDLLTIAHRRIWKTDKKL